uniref:B30.2/SPRY domain-containing protein n=1 Tax=Globodera rostochiensis TaxID=31243 RepID=A0A914H7M8_GLORO
MSFQEHSLEPQRKERPCLINCFSRHRSVCAEWPISKDGIFYYEVKILEKEIFGIYIGLATKLPLFVGYEKGTYSYGSRGEFWGQEVEKCLYDNNKRPYIDGKLPFKKDDVIGCGVDLAKGRKIIYTLNGKLLETPDLRVDSATKLYPCVSMFKAGTKIEANFGTKKFEYTLPKTFRN